MADPEHVTDDQTVREILPSSGQNPSEAEDQNTRRKRRRRKGRDDSQAVQNIAESTAGVVPEDPSVQEFAPQYLQFSDDILAPEEEEADASAYQEPNRAMPEMTIGDSGISQPTTSVFVQQSAGFKKAEREKMLQVLEARYKKQVEESGGWDRPITNTMTAGVILQKVFHTLGIILQGFLAGFALCHCCLVFLFTPPFSEYKTFLDVYSRFALPTHSIYYVGFSLCTVAALDRYDVGQSILRMLHRTFTFQSGGLAVIAYASAVVLSLLSRPVEERMTLYFYHNRTLLFLPPTDANPAIAQPWLETDMNLWKGTLIARAVMGLVGWCLIAARPATDLLQKHMVQAEEDFSAITKKAKSHDNDGDQ